MKKTLLIGLIFLCTICCKAQNILPVEKVIEYRNSETGIPQNITQIKDLNGLLNKFIGIWKGDYNSKNYEFRIVKHTRQSTTRNLSEDELLIRYKIIEANGTVLENTLDLANDSPYVIHGSYLASSGSYVLYYQGKEHKCGQNGDVFIRVLNNTNDLKMKLFLNVAGEMYADLCPNGAVQQMLPTDLIDLTKQ